MEYDFLNKDNPAKEENLRKRQQLNLKLLNEFIDILDKNNLNYSLVYGTALGFYRDKKMIDWDCDIDVLLDFEAYEFLLKNYPNNLMTSKNTKWHSLQFPRWVPDLNTADIKDPNSIYLDLFIIIPTEHKKINWYLNSLYTKLQAACSWRDITYQFKERKLAKFQRFVLWSLCFWVPKLTMERTYKKLFSINPNTYFISNWPLHKEDNSINISDFYNPKVIYVNGKNYKIMNNIEKYFEKWYGKNWTTPIKNNRSVYYGFTEMYSD
ncbi:diacylglycerol cholinephosphotransferase Mf1 [Mycoplasmopsis felifaucium]|uniref:LicD family protein n=1 Tax=Mycoplasmopsis felifaucium TaxID=35768 RepID=A0ABZ2RS90_9BACT|nr:LicD family protein [Mycoplasmopsis felifaucium]